MKKSLLFSSAAIILGIICYYIFDKMKAISFVGGALLSIWNFYVIENLVPNMVKSGKKSLFSIFMFMKLPILLVILYLFINVFKMNPIVLAIGFLIFLFVLSFLRMKKVN